MDGGSIPPSSTTHIRRSEALFTPVELGTSTGSLPFRSGGAGRFGHLPTLLPSSPGARSCFPRYDDVVSSEPISVVLHDDLADVVRREASRTGRTEAEVVELAVQRLALPPILDRLWERATLSEDEAMAIAVEETRAVRAQRRAS